MTARKTAFAAFRKTVYRHFAQQGRALPWRKNVTPYRVFVSEVMLQQTQVPRVAEFFPKFIERFPDWERLASADLRDVFAEWQGLGYNRRAKFLHQAARMVMAEHGGKLPDDPEILRTFPGIGKATAASIAAFAFDRPTVFVETNIRAVFIHHFFKDKEGVPDDGILKLVEETLDRKNPRKWYSALMDYGTELKRLHQNPARRSAHHKIQARFEGSARQARGKVLKALVAAPKPLPLKEVAGLSGLLPERAKEALESLVAEGLVKRSRNRFSV